MKSVWESTVNPPQFERLSENVSTDVLIIGGGMAGVLCAYELQRRGIEYLLLEGRTIGRGTTRGTTGVLTAQHDARYTDLTARFGADKAKGYLNANLGAVKRFRSLAREVPCDFEERPSFQYTTVDPEPLKREAEAVNALGFPARFVIETPLPFPVSGAVVYPGMAQFHPLKFLYGIVRGLNIRENSFVYGVDGIRGGEITAYTLHGDIKAKRVVMAAHFPFIDRRGLYFMKMFQMRSFVIALENAPDFDGTYVNADSDTDDVRSGIYLRHYQGLLLAGGGDHRTGKQGGGFEAVRAFCRAYLPNVKEKYVWAAQDCMALDEVPYIGQYSPATPNLYVATGFNEWGMTSSMIAADILADLLSGRENPYAEVFTPRRSMLRKQFFINLGETLCNFVIPKSNRCSHLGCALKWNPFEHSWDCPCHGSRFDEHGGVIDNPAAKPARPPKKSRS
ncbi:MAG TPA: FAD-dependent oxidoreductase [Oscillospiraceae bacterium]|nr:FAD-dependent oxidoreductase [Oscillospiraceae bacterium]HPF55645.1 FAD-dependent oxidoreductase [Clostridiales bacterium]HPK34737.1 FAD-dependent oxidoreductase [Oscillospiraceae bacterium]HPR76069.1 FAD-dependent oxidoreductase [Oscillospiraceae bacterium]